MNNKVTDYTQRKTALDPAMSFIVQAPAGSGKTGLLIQRYLRLLALVEHPEEIVAITFTRKAAAEMQGRILQALAQARQESPPTEDNQRLTYDLARAALVRDAAQGWQLERNPGRLRIQTIDSLCSGLTRRLPVLARFGSQPGIVEDALLLYREAATNTLAQLEIEAEWADDIAVVLAHLDNNLPLARDLLAGMLERRDQWLRHVARNNTREDLEAALQHIVESTLDKTRRTFPEQHEHEFLECLRYAAANVERDRRASPLILCAGIDHLPGVTAIELPRWQAIADMCLTQKDGWRKQANIAIGFPSPEGSAAEKAQRKAMKDRFQALLAQLSGDDELLEALIEVRYLPPIRYTEQEWRVVSALCRLLVLAEAQLRVLFGEIGQVDFTGVARAAIEALETEGDPTDLALYLDYQIRHLLIDEYQDVSIQQYRLLELLTAGWAPGDGHTLFLVGDPMQSIYRFREAEVGLFITTWQERRLGQVPLEPLRITVNFRAQAGIVEWVNRSFQRILPVIADSARGAVSYSAAEASHAEVTPDAVVVHPLTGRDDRAEAARVVDLVRAARQRDPEGNIAILVRNRSHVPAIAAACKNAGMKFRAVDIDPLGGRPAVQDLLALTLALNHGADRIAWLAILRAPWCGLELGDLLSLAGDDDGSTIRNRIYNDKVLALLTPAGRQRLYKLRSVLQHHFDAEGRRSLRRSLEAVWMSLGGPATVENEADLENAEAFFDLLELFDRGGVLREREEFIKAVEKLFAAPGVAGDVPLQIMTIHKAKGLEFDTVIVPGLDRGTRRDDARLLLWTELPHGLHQDLLLAPIKETGAEPSRIYDFVARLEKEKQHYELGRLLYVACTRAKRQLHLLGAVEIMDGEPRAPASDTLLGGIWPVVEAHYTHALENDQFTAQPAASLPPVRSQSLRRLTADWSLPAPPPSLQWRTSAPPEPNAGMPLEYEWAGEAIRHVGTVVHRYLQLIADEGIGSWDDARAGDLRPEAQRVLRRLGVRDEDLEWSSATVVQALRNTINDERGRWLFHPGHSGAQNEYRLSGMHEGRVVNVIIDRTFVDAEGVRWAVDYKTSRHAGPDLDAFLDREQERHRAQLEKYGALLQNFDGRPVRLGLYFPVLRGWREIKM